MYFFQRTEKQRETARIVKTFFFEKLQKELIEDAAKRGITLTKADFIETREWQEEELTISAKKKDMLDTHCTCFASGVGTAG